MKNIYLLFLLCLFSFPVPAQKVSVEIIKAKNAAVSEWQILDENYQTVFPGNEYFRDDSIFVSLEANKRYFLQISISELYNSNANLYLLLLDRSPLLRINSDIEPGDYFYPFFTGTRDLQTKIVGGTDASISDFPWQIYLIAGDYMCGGSIISPNWVVTAAHCVKQNGITISASSMRITAGATNPRSTYGTNYSVSQVIPHENYNSITLENDIALLKINVPISCQYCQPIKLINADNVAEGATDPGVMTWITGWGLTSASSSVNPINLQKALLPIVSSMAASVIWGAIPSTDIMAGYIDGNKDACSGDSGGPMSVPVSGEYRLAGIVSWGSSKCNTYGAYTRVSALESWIREKTGIVDYAPPAPSGDSIVCQGTDTSYYSTGIVPGATAYEWQLFPSDAGKVTWNSENAMVVWKSGYIGSVSVKVRVTLNTTYSEWAKRTVKKAVNTKLLIQPGDTIKCEGNYLSLVVQAEGTNLNYSWYKDGNVYQTGISNQIYYQNLIPSNSGNYKCQVAGLCGTLSTKTISLTVYPLTVISGISPDIITDYGTNVTLSVDATGHDLVYKWKHNNVSLENSNSPLLVMQNVDARNIGLYWSVVKGSCGTEISDSSYVYLTKETSPVNPEISVWPTVTSDEVNIASSAAEAYNIRIVSLAGKLMYSLTNCHYQTTIKVGHYPKGFYIINISDSMLNKSFRLIKE